MTTVYRPTVYSKDGVALSGTWYNKNNEPLDEDADWTMNYNTFKMPMGGTLNTSYVLVDYKKEISGGKGVQNVVGKIWRAELNGQEMSFVSFDDRLKNRPNVLGRELSIVKDHQIIEAYFAYDQDTEAAARVVELTITASDIVNDKYVVDDSDFDGRKVIGIVGNYSHISNVEKNTNNQIVLTFSEKKTTILKLALSGHLIKYKNNSRTLVSEFLVAKTIKYELSSTVSAGSPIYFFARNENENVGIIKSFLNMKDKNTDSDQKLGDVFLNGVKQADSDISYISGIGTSRIKIYFSKNIAATPTNKAIIEIPVLMTYQPTEYDVVNIWYDYVPYQGLLSKMPGYDSDKFNKNLHRLSDWKMFSTVLGSSYLEEEEFNNTLRPPNTTLNAIDRLPGGLSNSHNVTNVPNDQSSFHIEFIDEGLSRVENYEKNKYIRFHDKFINLIPENKYENILNDLVNSVVIRKEGSEYRVKTKRHGDEFLSDLKFQGSDTTGIIHKYDGAACLVADERGEVFMLVMGKISLDQTNVTQVDSTFVDLFKVDNVPSFIPRKIDLKYSSEIPSQPDIPKYVSISFVSNSKIKVKWDKPFSEYLIMNYLVLLIDASNDQTIKSIETKLTSCEIDSLDLNKEYKVSVITVDELGHYSPSSDVIFDTKTNSKPTTPLNFFIDNVDVNTCKIHWSASWHVNGIKEYEVYRQTGDNPAVKIATIPNNLNSTGLYPFVDYTINIDNLDEYTRYGFAVKAISNNDVVSNQAGFTYIRTLDKTSPTEPSNFTVTATGASTCKLTWNKSEDSHSGVDKYIVYMIDVSDKSVKQIASINHSQDKNTYEYTANNLREYSPYGFAVRAVDKQENTNTTEYKYVRTLDKTPPTSPSELTILSRQLDSIKLKWTPSVDNLSGLSHYVVLLNDQAQADIGDPLIDEYTFSNLTPSTTYDLGVRAVDKSGNQSSIVSITVRTL